MTENQKNLVFGTLIGLGIISFLAAVTSSPSIPSRDAKDVPESVALSQEMPPEAGYSYSMDEYTIINDMVSKGMVIRHYKRTFTNLTRQNFDVESIYQDFDKDMSQYIRQMKEDIIRLQALRPAREGSQLAQKETLERAESLYYKLSEYKEHEKSKQDTLEFLNSCIYELDRLNQQAKLPRD